MARAPDYKAPPIPQWTAVKSAPLSEDEATTNGSGSGTGNNNNNNNNNNNIVEVNGDSFKAEVVDVSTDVLVLVHAPWCAHCKSFEPVFDRVAQAVGSAVSTLKVCRMDGDKNDVHGLTITSFPTLFVFPALDKSDRGVVTYGGEAGWTAAAVLGWAAKSTTFAFDPQAVARVAAGLKVGEQGEASGDGSPSDSIGSSKEEL
jgi:thiol-disulfide isomerase/thioredoxin